MNLAHFVHSTRVVENPLRDGRLPCINVGDDAMAVYDALLREGVIVRPVENYAMPGFLRVSVGLAAENQRAIDALQHTINR